MKKLKTWQIVLLVIFYPIGICVWIYRVWKKNKLKRDAAAAAVARREAKEREDAARLEAWRAERAARETLKFKVVGVTFKNEDGKSRQTLLRKLHFGDAPFNSDDGVDITIERGAYQGEPAFSVFTVYNSHRGVMIKSKGALSVSFPILNNCAGNIEGMTQDIYS